MLKEKTKTKYWLPYMREGDFFLTQVDGFAPPAAINSAPEPLKQKTPTNLFNYSSPLCSAGFSHLCTL